MTDKKLRILVVEDEVIIAMGLQRKLSSMGYDVVDGLARTAEEALLRARESKPDLVLMDIRLEGAIDGIEAASQIKAQFDIPVVFLSAYSDSQTLERAKKTDPYGYVLKPIAERELRIAIDIAIYRRQSEVLLKQRDEQIRSILNAAYDAFIAIDSDGKIMEWNRQAEAIFGWKHIEVIGNLLVNFLMPDRHKEAYHKELKQFINIGKSSLLHQRVQMPLLHKGGHEILIELTVSPVKIGSAFIFGAFLRDITGQKRTEKLQAIQLRATQIFAKSESIVEAVPELLKTMCKGLMGSFAALWEAKSTGDHNCLELSHIWFEPDDLEMHNFVQDCRQFRFAQGEGLPGRVWESGQPEWIADVAIESSFVRAPHAVDVGLKSAFAFPIVAGSNVTGVVEFFSRYHSDVDNQTLELMADFGAQLGMFIQRKEAESSLRCLYQELEQRVEDRTRELQLITDALPVSIIYLDLDLSFRFVNATYAAWRMLPKHHIVGKHFSEVIGEHLYRNIAPYFDKVLCGEVQEYDAIIDFPIGQKISSVLNIPDFDAKGKVRGIICIVTDITHHRSVADELRSAKEAAESANRAKSAFLANMSHEIRTPIGVILGFSELLASPDLRVSEREDYVEAVKRNGELLSTIINDILDLSKVEAGKLEVEVQNVTVGEILSDLMTLLNLQAVEKGIRLTVSSEGAIPSTIKVDSLRLRQILLNIVGNAIKFTNKGSVEVKIKQLATENEHPRLAFVVTDTGIGISEEQVSRLFEPFSQADISTRRRFGGTGLGLTLARRLANLLGGDVVLTKSEVGKGSTFTITIDPGPIQQVLFENYEGLPKQNNSSLSLPSINLSGVSVLLVEDVLDNQLLVTRFLKTAGAAVETAENGREALERVEQGTYDILLMDLQMPVMDGYEATAELRKQGYEKPIIALSAHVLKEVRQRCLAEGFNDHLAKPIDRGALIETIARHTSGASESSNSKEACTIC